MKNSLAPQDAGSFSVLVIDDDPSVREVLADYLLDQGFDVGSETCGETGVMALERRRFDIVITDLRMPGMSGLDVVRRVRERSPETEVMVITGYATIEDGVEAMRGGAYDFLLKPIKIEQFQAILTRCTEWIRFRRNHAELEAVNRKLLEVSRMKEKFLAITDHELRTPVTVIDGMLHLISRRSRELPEDLRARIESLTQVSRRLVDLVRGVHDLVQSRGSHLPVCLDETRAGEVAKGVLLDFEIAAFSRQLTLELTRDVPDELPLHADIHRLRQAVTELVQNAVKATPDGGRVDVRLSTRSRNGRRAFCVAVADTGIGIEPEEQQKVFELFYEVGDERHHHTSKLAFGGSGMGMGLSIALEIARAHGGEIELESTPGTGSTFTLSIPLP